MSCQSRMERAIILDKHKAVFQLYTAYKAFSFFCFQNQHTIKTNLALSSLSKNRTGDKTNEQFYIN